MPQFEYVAHESATQPTELVEVVLDRVDGVGDPATGLPFFMLKSQTAQLREDLQAFVEKSRMAFEALQAAELPLSAELVTALNAVTKDLGLGEPFVPALPGEDASADATQDAAPEAEPVVDVVESATADDEAEADDDDVAKALDAVALDALLEKKLEPMAQALAGIADVVRELQRSAAKPKPAPAKPIVQAKPKPVAKQAETEVSWANVIFPHR